MGRDKLSSNPVDQLRKKEKEKERAKNRKFRSEQFERQFTHGKEADTKKYMALLKSKCAGEEPTHRSQNLLSRAERLFKKHGEKMEESWQVRTVAEEKKAQEKRLTEAKENAMFSVYYDREKNPYGIPPPGKPPLYRHPDGQTRSKPPFQGKSTSSSSQMFRPPAPPSGPPPKVPNRKWRNDGYNSDDDSESDDDVVPQPPPCPPPPENAPPGFSYNPTTQFLAEINRAQADEAERAAKNKVYFPRLPTCGPEGPQPEAPRPVRKRSWQEMVDEAKLEEKKMREKAEKATERERIEQTAQREKEKEMQNMASALSRGIILGEGRGEGTQAASEPTVVTTIEAKATAVPSKPALASFIPTVLRTKQTRTVSTAPQVSAFSLGSGIENTILTAEEKQQGENERLRALEIARAAQQKLDIDAAVSSFMKEV